MLNRYARITIVKTLELNPENYKGVEWPEDTEPRDLTDPNEMMEFEQYLLEQGDTDFVDILDYGKGEDDVEVTWELMDPKAKTATDAETPFSDGTGAASDAGRYNPKDVGAKAAASIAAARKLLRQSPDCTCLWSYDTYRAWITERDPKCIVHKVVWSPNDEDYS